MSIGERIKELRMAKGLTQQAFADKLSLKRNTIGGYEIGTVVPSDRTIADICDKFGVNEIWLRNGGNSSEMFKPAPSNALDVLANEYGLTHGDYVLIEKFLGLSPKSRRIIVRYIEETAAALAADDTPSDAPAVPGNLCSSIVDKVLALNSGQKNTAAARSGDRIDVAEVSAQDEESALPPSYSGDI